MTYLWWNLPVWALMIAAQYLVGGGFSWRHPAICLLIAAANVLGYAEHMDKRRSPW
jgi:hypothetical protein